MQIRVQCPACKASFEVPTALLGRDGECSQCQKVFRVTSPSGEVDASVLTSGNSNATLEMPIVNDDRPAPDTDEFEIPEAPSNAAQPTAPELDVPELEVPATPPSDPKTKEPAAELPQVDVEFADASEDELPPILSEAPPILIEEDGSLFGDEIPELEEVRESVSRYASEDEEDPDAGDSYSLSGSSPSPAKRKSKKARRKKATKKKQHGVEAIDRPRGKATAGQRLITVSTSTKFSCLTTCSTTTMRKILVLVPHLSCCAGPDHSRRRASRPANVAEILTIQRKGQAEFIESGNQLRGLKKQLPSQESGARRLSLNVGPAKIVRRLLLQSPLRLPRVAREKTLKRCRRSLSRS